MQLTIPAQAIAHIEPQFATELRLADDTTIKIESPYRITRPGAAAIDIDPSEPDANQEPLTALQNMTLQSVVVDQETNSLTLEFSDGARVRVAPDPDYEAWTVWMPDGTIVVSQPGGQVTTFPPAK